MKRAKNFLGPVIASLCVMLVLPASVNAVGHISPDGKPIYAPYFPYLTRTNIVVADIERSLRVYRDILGFDVSFQVPVRPGGIIHETFNLDPDLKGVRFAALDSGKGEFGIQAKRKIGLTQVPGYEPPTDKIFSHTFIIEVSRDMKELRDLLLAEELDVGELIELELPERTEFVFSDFDGHRIIIMKKPGFPEGEGPA